MNIELVHLGDVVLGKSVRRHYAWATTKKCARACVCVCVCVCVWKR